MDAVKCVTCERFGSGSCGVKHYPSPAAAFLTGLGAEQSPFYAPATNGLELKENVDSRWTLPYASMYRSYESPMLPGHTFVDSYRMELNGARRKNATRETTSTLKAWLYEHRKNPYPTKAEKIMLAIVTKMTLTQVSTWFANARRRLKKENKMTWSPRNRNADDVASEDEIGSNNGVKDSLNSGDNDTALSADSKNYKSSANEVRNSGANGFGKVKEEGESDLVDIENDSISGKQDFREKRDLNLESGRRKHSQEASESDNHKASNDRPGKEGDQMKTRINSHHHHSHLKGIPIADGHSQENYNDSDNQRPVIWSLAQTAASNSPTVVMNKAYKSPTEWTLNGCVDTSTQDEMGLATSGYRHHHNGITPLTGSSVSGGHHLPASIIRTESGNCRLSGPMNWSATAVSSSSSSMSPSQVGCGYQLPFNSLASDCGTLMCTDKCKQDCSSSRTSPQSPPPTSTSSSKPFGLQLTGASGSNTGSNGLHHNGLISSVTASFTASSMSSCIPSSSSDSYSPYPALASSTVLDNSEFRCNSMIIMENNHHHHQHPHPPASDVRNLMHQNSGKNSSPEQTDALHIANDNLYKQQQQRSSSTSNTLLGKVFTDYVSSPSPSSSTNPRTMDMSPESYMSSSPSPKETHPDPHHHRSVHLPLPPTSSSLHHHHHHHPHHPKRTYPYLTHHFNFTV